MKFIISAKRDSVVHTWSGYIDKEHVTACPYDVSTLFTGMTRALAAKFEISNAKPRYFDYHTFIWNGDQYIANGVRGHAPRITGHVSGLIQKVFKNKGEKYAHIYVSIY